MADGKFDTAEKRWAGIGPYYAMFPVKFADAVIKQYTKEGDVVLDPFAGRATAIYSAAVQGRIGFGIELNPVGWVYGKAKLSPARQEDVEKRLQEISHEANDFATQAEQLPIFFHYCFSKDVRRFLSAARALLSWRHRPTDWTLMALLLIYLHGKRSESLSNQMRQTKSMAPEYAIRWWKRHNMMPPDVKPTDFMMQRIKWRYAKGVPTTNGGQVYLGNCCEILPLLKHRILKSGENNIRLLFTSPPYFGVTNYHYDQWIRLWLLGFSSEPKSSLGYCRDRFNQPLEYKKILLGAFLKSSQLLSKDSVIYVRTDNRSFTLQTTLEVLKQAFPDKSMKMIERPSPKTTQTQLFGDRSPKTGEVDLILCPANKG